MAKNKPLPFAFGKNAAKAAQFIVECPKCPRPTIECMDEDGDLILQVGKLQCQHVRKGSQENQGKEFPYSIFRVCSRTFSRSSLVMKKMLYGGFAESKQPGDQTWTVQLPEDDPKALRVLLNIMHGCFNEVPSKTITIDDFYNIAVLSDKYGLTRVLQPWVVEWSRGISVICPHLLNGSMLEWSRGISVICPHLLNGSMWESGYLEKRLWISWELGDQTGVGESSGWIALCSAINSDGALIRSLNHLTYGTYFHDLVEPPEILDVILDTRLRAIKSVLAQVDRLINNLLDGEPRCEIHCASGISQCDALALGTMMRSLARAKLWPIPKPSEYTEDVLSLYLLFGHLPISKYCDNRTCMNEHFLERLVASLYTTAPDSYPELRDVHERHCAKQAKKSGVGVLYLAE